MSASTTNSFDDLYAIGNDIPVNKPNIILAEGVELTLNQDQSDSDIVRNSNILVVGGTGTNKMHSFVIPNINQYNSNFIFPDENGAIECQTCKGLLENGYKVYSFGIGSSDIFNPLFYTYSYFNNHRYADPNMIKRLCEVIVRSVNTFKDPFFRKMSELALESIILLLVEFYDDNEINLCGIYMILRTGLNDIDDLFVRSRNIDSKAPCLAVYNEFRENTPPTIAGDIINELAIALSPFMIDEFKAITSTDYMRHNSISGEPSYIKNKNGGLVRTENNINLYDFYTRKTALFVRTHQSDMTIQLIDALLYIVLFGKLYTLSDTICSDQYSVYAKDGLFLNSGFMSEADAKEHIEFCASSSIERFDTPDGHNKVFLYGKDSSLMPIENEAYAHKIVELCKDATIEKNPSYGLPTPVRVFLNDYIRMDWMPELPSYTVTSRKYNIPLIYIVHSLHTLNRSFGESSIPVIDECDTLLYTGGVDPETDRYMYELFRSNGASQKLLSNIGESKIPDENCIVMLRGQAPFIAKKYNY